jgi:hypothetical protein
MTAGTANKGRRITDRGLEAGAGMCPSARATGEKGGRMD